jgi:uncharacterized oligopeptide transporter (OPT) family protein
MADQSFKPFISPETKVAEFTLKSILTGAAFGIIFGASTVYLALKAGLTVSASIPIAVLAITLGRKFLKTTILENNIIQTTGSAGESIAAGVVFTLPGFLFLSEAGSANFFNFFTILTLAIIGGMLGTLMMIPLRRSLIVQEHKTLPYPEGTACASVLKAGEKGGDFARTTFLGLGVAIGIYLPLSTTFPIFIGGAVRGLVEWRHKQKNIVVSAEEEDLGKGNLFATGLVAGGALAGVLVAILSSMDSVSATLGNWNAEHCLSEQVGHEGYKWLGVGFFALMAFLLYRIAMQPNKK